MENQQISQGGGGVFFSNTLGLSFPQLPLKQLCLASLISQPFLVWVSLPTGSEHVCSYTSELLHTPVRELCGAVPNTVVTEVTGQMFSTLFL